MSRRWMHIAPAVIGLLGVVLAAVSCDWRELDYDYINTAKFTLIFKWDQSSLGDNSSKAVVDMVKPGDPINGRTAVFFPVDGSAPIIKMSHSDTMTVNLPVQEYNAVFFNETYDDFDNIRFSGTGSFETLLASAKEDAVTSTRSFSSIAREPDMLAVQAIVPFRVTEEMVFYTRAVEERGTKAASDYMGLADFNRVEEQMTIIVHPHDVVYPLIVSVTVEGLNNVVSAGAYITGFAGGFDFSKIDYDIIGFPFCIGSADTTSVTHRVNFDNNTLLDGSTRKGTLEGHINTFGPRIPWACSGYTLEFRALLIDGTIFTATRDVSGNMYDISENGQRHYMVYAGVGSEGSQNPPIIIPDVEPVAEGGGWQINVGDWDEIVVPVGM